jgi:hypothetical protein
VKPVLPRFMSRPIWSGLLREPSAGPRADHSLGPLGLANDPGQEGRRTKPVGAIAAAALVDRLAAPRCELAWLRVRR